MKLMDYSLLIGIHDCDRAYTEAEEEGNEENGGATTNVSTVHTCTQYTHVHTYAQYTCTQYTHEHSTHVCTVHTCAQYKHVHSTHMCTVHTCQENKLHLHKLFQIYTYLDSPAIVNRVLDVAIKLIH